MQSAKPSHHYRYGHYDVELQLFSERKLAITVIDSLQKVQYHEPECVLESIGVNTLTKAFELSKKQIQISFNKAKIQESDLLELKVSVDSAFLKPVHEVISLKKLRDVSEEESVKKALDFLAKKVKNLKESKEHNKLNTYYGGLLEQRNYTGSTYEPIASIKLPKGRYLLTFNFLLKANSSWIYIYLNQGQSLMANAGFYVPTNSHFAAHTIRKIYQVTSQTQEVQFTTYYASSYPVTIRNAIITAKPLPE